MAKTRLLLMVVVLIGGTAIASIFGAVRGIVHDSQHRPILGAMVTLRSNTSDFSKSVHTDANGGFAFNGVELGDYSITVSSPSFAQSAKTIAVHSGTEPVLHIQLMPAGASETVNVSGEPEVVPSDSATPVTMLSRAAIAETPGASRSNSLAMITDYVPGSYVTHDQLHVRGGHQTSWLIDGVPIPNTNIASNLGPQFDPKDTDYLEVDRGSYGAEFGDRTYGVFNIVPRTGFERNNEAEIVLSAGNFYQTNDQISLGSHTERFAYYASVNGNRSNLGIQTPVPQVVHDAANGYGGFGSLIFNLDSSNQFRFITSMRKDDYQIPYDPLPNDIENNPINGQYPSIGLRDGDHESDVLLNFSWVHTFNSQLMLTVSPFYHHNRANYESSPNDTLPDGTPDATTQERGSSYAGGQVSFDAKLPRNNLQLGMYSFYQKDDEMFAVNGGFPDYESPAGSLVSFFADDKWKATPWLTLSAGARPTRFSGGVTESAISPRFGAALNVPHLNWTLRGFYGHYYQAPPLITACDNAQNALGVCQFAASNGLGFTPLRGERDEEFQFGIAIPYRGWVLDADSFRTRVVNFFDHNNIGESNLFFPVTIQAALIRAWELTLHSPRIANRAQIHLAYSNQIAEGGGVITGGLNDSVPAAPTWPVALSPLDHDQRNTLNVGGDVILPWRAHAATNVNYGSGFSNAFPGDPYPGDYLPGHTTFDLSLSKEIGERCTVSVNGLNVANRRVELDNSVTFGGFHWNSPREIYGELRYRFHY